MTDRIHPSAKPSFPATKSQLSAANRPTYRHQPPQHRRGCFCTLCCYLVLILITLILLMAAIVTIFYFLYHPHPPIFSLTSLTLSSLNFNLTLSTTNPNNKITFSYAPTFVSILFSDTAIATATIPAFRHLPMNTTDLQTSITTTDEAVDAVTQLKRKSEVTAVKVKLETKVEAQMSVFQTPRVGITVLCDGVGVSIADGEKLATMNGENTTCEVNWRFKVWKWTIA